MLAPYHTMSASQTPLPGKLLHTHDLFINTYMRRLNTHKGMPQLSPPQFRKLLYTYNDAKRAYKSQPRREPPHDRQAPDHPSHHRPQKAILASHVPDLPVRD
jgi:hypothetical protein